MGDNRWAHIEELFHQAAELPAGERTLFLDRVCGGDGELRRELEGLLLSDHTEQGFLGLMQAALERAVKESGPGEIQELMGQRFGRYTITGLIGKGGMGAVYRAVREDDFRMEVAIKVMLSGIDTAAALSRFRGERQILAGLQHPNIAHLLDGGATESGLPYLVMEYVDGIPLLEYAGRLPQRRRLELFQSLCSAVHYAHQHQVVHRDIKPGNILVTRDGVPKLLDFGVAKVLDPTPLDPAAAPTAVGLRVMTPQYASPEQARGETVSAASDIYSLGLVLFELLTGRPAQRIETYSPAEIEREICTREPVSPSAITEDLDRDLDNIVLMALRKEPERRYRTAEELSADIGRFLSDLPVQARPEGVFYRGRKFMKRNRAAVVTAVVGAVAALAIMAGVGRFTGSTEAEPRSIAVLPLNNVSGDQSQEILAEGVTDALIDHLAQIPDVRVISRTSSMSFKGGGRKLPDIASSLGVRTIAEGSVLRSGDRIRLTVRLVDAHRERPLWNSTYEGGMQELVDLQGKVAAAIANEIGAALSARDQARTTRASRINLAAFDAYLKGRHQYYSDLSRESLEKSIEWFQKALTLDPGYARAYSGLADCYYMLSNTHLPPVEMMPKAKWAAEKALLLDPGLAEPHATLGLVASLYELDRNRGEEEFRRAIEWKPSDPLVHIWYAFHLAAAGQFDLSVAEIRRAAELDPVSRGINAYVSWPLFFARRFDQLIEQMKPLADASPSYNLPFATLGEAYAAKGDWAKAIPYLEKAHEMDGLPESMAQLGRAYGLAGRTQDARKMLQRLTDMSRRRFASVYNFALIHIGLGERDEAFQWLLKVQGDRSEWFAMLDQDPRLDPIRADPRFERVRRAAGLVR